MISKRNIEVTYSDTDMMGIVYHANYIVWFELGRSKFLRDMGFSLHDCFDHNLMFPIASINLKYISPTKFLDEVVVETEVLEFSKVSTTYLQKVYANGVLSVEGTVKLAHVDSETFKIVNIKKRYEELYNEYNKEYNNE